MRDVSFVEGEIYHVCNKAIAGNRIFSDAANRHRFLETALLVNDLDPRQLEWRREQFRSSGKIGDHDSSALIDTYALSLMPDHMHFLVRQKIEGGIPKFFQRLLNSFSKYYNIKHSRRGPLFIGPYKAVHIESDAQAAHIFTYIHGNPLDLVEPLWRGGIIGERNKAIKFLQEYEWSSLGAYAENVKTNPLIKKIINPSFANDYFADGDEYLRAVIEWGERNDVNDIENFE